jgi:hypothetical protein
MSNRVSSMSPNAVLDVPGPYTGEGGNARLG